MPEITFLTENRLDHIAVTSEELLYLKRNLNKDRSCGPDYISEQMLIICDQTIFLPLRIVCQQILSTGTIPQI